MVPTHLKSDAIVDSHLTRCATKILKPSVSRAEQFDSSDFEWLKLIHSTNSKIVVLCLPNLK
jgi:hypothetical protein